MTWPLLLLALAAAPAPSAPVPNGVLVGTVRDAATGAPLPGVVVTVRAPEVDGELVAVTDETGTFRVPQLPPGVYALGFAKERFVPLERGDVQLRLGRTVRIDVRLGAAPATPRLPATGCDGTLDDVEGGDPCAALEALWAGLGDTPPPTP